MALANTNASKPDLPPDEEAPTPEYDDFSTRSVIIFIASP
jgi:hypothetical protein